MTDTMTAWEIMLKAQREFHDGPELVYRKTRCDEFMANWTEPIFKRNDRQPYYDYDKRFLDRLWSLISRSLILLAIDQPSGDDSVYDYWPNAYEMVQKLYAIYQEPIPNQSKAVVEDYFIHHFKESCGILSDELEEILYILNIRVLANEPRWDNRPTLYTTIYNMPDDAVMI